MSRMTPREAIAICRAQAAKESGPVREALEICAETAEAWMRENEAEWRGDLCHE